MASIKTLFIALVVCAQLAMGSLVSSSVRGGSGHWRENLHQEVAKLGLSADVTATIEESLFVNICNTVVPLINQYVQGLVIPGQSESHFSFGNIVIQTFHIDGISITFSSPSSIQVSLSQISFAVPQTDFSVFAKILFVHVSCSGKFWASMTGTNIYLSMATSESNGNLVFGDAQSSVSWGSLSVNHQFDHTLCKITQDIIQLFIGSVNTLIKNLVEKDIPEKIGPMMQNALDKALAKLPLDFVSQPVVTSQSISLTVDLLGHPAGVAIKGPQHSARTRAIAPRDLELEVPATAVNSLLQFAQMNNLLHMNVSKPSFNTTAIEAIFPTVYSQCPGCPFEIDLTTTQAPSVSMSNDTIGMAITQGTLGLNIASPSGNTISFVDLWINASLSVSDVSVRSASFLYFQVSLQSFALGIRQSSIGPFDISLITHLVSVALNDIVIPAFDITFNGIPLPQIASDVEVAVSDSAVFVGFNVNLTLQ